MSARTREGAKPFPEDTINRRVEDRLIALADARCRFGVGDSGAEG
jgi:hypothetical protein